MFVASAKDIQGAIAVLALSIVPIVVGLPSAVVQTSPTFIRLLWGGIVAFMVYNRYFLTAVVFIAVGLMIQFGYDEYSHTAAMARFSEVARNDPRFNESVDLDLQIANDTLSRDPARWLDPGRKKGPLLLYPPTPEQLQMAGSNGK